MLLCSKCAGEHKAPTTLAKQLPNLRGHCHVCGAYGLHVQYPTSLIPPELR